MIVEVTGDILLSEAECIVHGVAPNDHFLNGLANLCEKNFRKCIRVSDISLTVIILKKEHRGYGNLKKAKNCSIIHTRTCSGT